MFTEAPCAAGAAQRGPGLASDERGAIMVLGIFMCTCMVGALWYLAGIGDAIIYRERMQEGADAVAFSGAALHARGMNMIVLLNLIMALILAIRVALKAIYLALEIIGALLSLIPVVGSGLAAPFFTAAQVTDSINSGLRQPINQSIKVLSKAQEVLARLVPPAALFGSWQVGERYAPIVENSAAGSPTMVANGLPVQNDSAGHLCEKAGEAVGEIIGSIVPIPGLGSGLGSAVGKLAKAGGFYFCEIGDASVVGDLTGGLDEALSGSCDTQLDELRKEATKAQENYDDKCKALGCDTGATLTEAEQAELDAAAAARDAARDSVDNFSKEDCEKDSKQTANKAAQDAMQKNSQGGSGDGMFPKMIKQQNPPWVNGIKDSQIVAVAEGSFGSLRAGKTGSRVGAWKTPLDAGDPPPESKFAIAQAEFFFDCDQAWTGQHCNGRPQDSNSMWRLRWRARLRRYNDPFTGGGPVTDFLAGGRWALTLASAAADVAPTPQNFSILADLAKAAATTDLIIH